MASLDRNHVIAQVNAAMAKLLRMDRKALVGLALIERLEAVGEQTQIMDGVRTFRFDAETERYLRLDLHPTAQGELAMLVDVSAEQRRFDHVRRLFNDRNRLMHDAEIGVWSYDPDREIYSFSSELALGHETAGQPVPLGGLQKIQHADDRAKDTEIREHITTHGGAADSEMRYRDGEGGWRTLRVLYRSGQRLPSGRYEMFGLSQNVTALARARDEATINAQRLKLALKAARAGVFEYDFKTESFWLSPEFRELVGPETLAASAGQPTTIYHPDDRELVARVNRAEHDTTEAIDVRLLRPDGVLWVRLYWQTQRNAAGELIRGVGLLLDIDDQKHQELALTEARRVAEAATASRTSFLASVSHEIRTPMNGIVGVLHLLERELLSIEARDLLGEALSCSDMLGQLINDVLDFSKMEAGKLEVSPVPTDPVAVMASVAALIHPQADAKNLYLRTHAEGLEFAQIDPVRLRQCLFNVIGNAVKFTESGGVDVTLAYVGAGDHRKLRCEVRDTGIGVPESARAALFDRFQQADSSTTRKFGGTGLGLAISRSLARMMGGDMDFTSVEGEGSTFWFELEAPHAERPAAVAEPSGATPLTGLRILVVDDNRMNRLVGLKTLEALGAEVETADSGEAAIAAVERGDFDLVLMDINMPGMDGMEATGHIRRLNSPSATVPVIALTADVMSHHQTAYHVAGMNGFVPKPFSPTQLLVEIAKLSAKDEPEAIAV